MTSQTQHKSPITTHVLDTMSGKPASGMMIDLEQTVGNEFSKIASGVTDSNGRIGNLLALSQGSELAIGVYRMTFYTLAYFQQIDVVGFYPKISIEFEVTSSNQHYHIPLLISPFGYSTYRGS